MALARSLDEVAPQRFPAMTMVTVRGALKEIQAISDVAAIGAEIAKLTTDQRDTLMKVLYVGLGKDFKNSSTYFKWHAAAYGAGGAGSIIRVITDKEPKIDPDSQE
jgi:hypothetical protein